MSSTPAAPGAASQQQRPPYPSMQELRDAQGPIRELPGKLGLIWSLNGNLGTAVLLKEGTNEPEPYGTSAGTNSHDHWHVFATSSLTETKISSITVEVTELATWEDDWYERHCEHSDPDGDYGPDFEWQSFPDWNPDVMRVKCSWSSVVTSYGRNKTSSLKVTAAIDGPGFVTLHD